MLHNLEAAILQQPIASLQVSQYFKIASREMGFLTLQDIVDTKEKTIMNKTEFTHEWLVELIRLMREYGFVNLLEASERF